MKSALGDETMVVLAAGPLTLQFCPRSGMIRDVRAGEVEVLRGVYVAVRDENWGTAPAVLDTIEVDPGADRFRVSFIARCREGPIDFRWKGEIRVDPDGTIIYAMDGETLTAFLRNRIGICVLHPIRECAGRPCTIEKTDGSIEQGLFPADISPHQPFCNIRSIAHEPAPGLRVKVKLDGEVFEMEDQRNWSDASFKTYGTPLDLPFPVLVPSGSNVCQSVIVQLSLNDWAKKPKPRSASNEIVVELGRVVRLPKLGLCVASHGQELSLAEIARLHALRLDHLRVDLRLWEPGHAEAMRQSVEQAVAIGASIHLALHVDDQTEERIVAFFDELHSLQPPLAACLLFHRNHKVTSPRWLDVCRPLLKERWPAAAIGAGTNANFAELNRERLSPGLVEVACFTINPQVHAFDDQSLAESLETQPQMVACARAFTRSAIAVSPITLKPQFNPNATAAEAPAPSGQLPPHVDPRQCSLFAAVWTLGSIAQLAVAETAIATYFETTGWLGVMETESGSPLPDKFPSRPGAVFPIYHVLADLAEAADCEVRCLESDHPSAIRGLLLQSAGRRRLLLANLTEKAMTARTDAVFFEPQLVWRSRLLGPSNVVEACSHPEAFREQPGEAVVSNRMELPPYSYACLEACGKGRGEL
jgi:hypothetical protein